MHVHLHNMVAPVLAAIAGNPFVQSAAMAGASYVGGKVLDEGIPAALRHSRKYAEKKGHKRIAKGIRKAEHIYEHPAANFAKGITHAVAMGGVQKRYSKITTKGQKKIKRKAAARAKK